MRNLSFFAIIIFCQNLILAQNTTVTVIDSLSRLPIQDVQIFENDKILFVTDIDGKALGTISNPNPKLTFKHLNFISKSVTISSDTTIYLIPNKEKLASVKINSKNKRLFPKKSLISRVGWFKGYAIRSDQLYATFIKNKIKRDGFSKITKVIVQTNKGYWGDPSKNFMPFKVNLFSLGENNLPGQRLIKESILVKASEFGNKYLEIDVSRFSVDLPKEGVYVVVEALTTKEYRFYFKNGFQSPIFKILAGDKNTLDVTYSQKDGEFTKLDFVYNFGIEIRTNF